MQESVHLKGGGGDVSQRSIPTPLQFGMPAVATAFSCLILMLFAATIPAVVMVLQTNQRSSVDLLTSRHQISELALLSDQVRSSLNSAKVLNRANAETFSTGVMTRLEMTQHLLASQVDTHELFAFVSSNYPYATDSSGVQQWGYAGWNRLDEYYYFTNATGWCNAFAANSSAGLDFTEPFISFPVDAVNDTYVTAPLASPHGAWTPIYPYPITTADGSTRMDLFLTHGQPSLDGGSTWNVDMDLNYLNAFLAKLTNTPTAAVLFVVEASSGLLVASSVAAALVDEGGNRVLVSESSHALLRSAASALFDGSAVVAKGEDLSTTTHVQVDGVVYSVAATTLDDGWDPVLGTGLHWMLVSVDDKSVYYDTFDSRVRLSAGIIAGVLLAIMLCIALSVSCVARRGYVLHSSSKRHLEGVVDPL